MGESTKNEDRLRLILRKGSGAQVSSYIWVRQDEGLDPNGSAAWEKLTTDLQQTIGLTQVASWGFAPVAEFRDTYEYRGCEVYLDHDADAGDIEIRAETDTLLHELLERLSRVEGYERVDR